MFYNFIWMFFAIKNIIFVAVTEHSTDCRSKLLIKKIAPPLKMWGSF